MTRLASLLAATILTITACSPDAPTVPSTTTSGAPTGTHLVRETVIGTISALMSPPCTATFVNSVDPAYYSGGLQRCAEFSRHSTTAGIIVARLTWDDRRIDLDLVLNNGAGMNFRQSIAANRSNERLEFFVNAGTSYIFIAYLRGVDPVFLSNGGLFTGPVVTPFAIEIERPL